MRTTSEVFPLHTEHQALVSEKYLCVSRVDHIKYLCVQLIIKLCIFLGVFSLPIIGLLEFSDLVLNRWRAATSRVIGSCSEIQGAPTLRGSRGELCSFHN